MSRTDIKAIRVGDKASFSKTITETDVILFAGISGDVNPIHINAEYAEASLFRSRIAHGMLCAGLISAVIGMQLPGPGTIYLGQELQFRKPVYIGDTVTAIVTVEQIVEDRNRVVLQTVVQNQRGEQVVFGKALVLPPKAP